MEKPTHNYEVALGAVVANPQSCLTSECPLEVLLAQESLTHPVPENAIARAYEIYKYNLNSKIVMESMLFCLESQESLIKKIATHMHVAEVVVEYYAHYFFDAKVFRDMFDRLDYLEHLSYNSDVYSTKGKVAKQQALTEGFSYMLSFFKGGTIEYTASDYTKKLLSIANRLVVQAQNCGIMSDEAERLFKWMGMGSKLAITLRDMSDDNVEDALQDIRIALEFDEAPKDITDIKPEDVLRG